MHHFVPPAGNFSLASRFCSGRRAGNVISKTEEYRTRAIACEMRAKEVTDPAMKRQFEELAMQWHYMANQTARHGFGDQMESGDADSARAR
jgi:hypothetical protein